MPKIPTFSPGPVQAPRLQDPNSAAAPGRALAGAAEKVGSAIQGGLQDIQRAEAQRQKEDSAELQLTILDMNDRLMRTGQAFDDKLKDRPVNQTTGKIDWQGIEEEAQAHITAVREQFLKEAGPNKNLQVAIGRSLSQYEKETVAKSKVRKLDLQGKQADDLSTGFQRSQLDSYSHETDPERLKLIESGIEAHAAELVATDVWNEEKAGKFIVDFKTQAGSLRADVAIDTDPSAALPLLKGSGFPEFDGDPQLRRDKITKAEDHIKALAAHQKIALAAAEKEAADANKAAHDAAERSVGDMFARKEYGKVVPYLLSRPEFTGDEVRTWTNAVQEKLSGAGKEVNATERAKHIINITGMIDRSYEPNIIRNYILTAADLPTADQEQMILRLDSKLNTEHKEARNAGHDVITGLIFPQGGLLTKMQASPLQTMALANGLNDYDTWFQERISDGKPPTIQEARQMGGVIGQRRGVTFADIANRNAVKK